LFDMITIHDNEPACSLVAGHIIRL